MASYPWHEKLRGVRDQSQTIGAFLEWLRGDRGLVLADYHQHTEECGRIPRDRINLPAACGYCEDQLQTQHIGIEALLAEYFEINLLELEQEKRRLLDEVRRGA